MFWTRPLLKFNKVAGMAYTFLHLVSVEGPQDRLVSCLFFRLPDLSQRALVAWRLQ